MKFNCDCGTLAGEISNPEELRDLRFVCMCNDCQTYARFLGRSEVILDENGGTEVVPVFPKLLRITAGAEVIRGIKLTSGSGTYRWYASCCRSPLANSLSSRAGYIGLVTRRLIPSDREGLGPICVRANGESGIPPLPRGTSKKFPLKWIFITLRQIVRMNLKRWKRPNPFFDERDQPIHALEVIVK
jgi:hypothetical protein